MNIFEEYFYGSVNTMYWNFSGPLDRLTAQPLDRYGTPFAIGSAIGRPYLASTRRQEL